eukprot:254544_1
MSWQLLIFVVSSIIVFAFGQFQTPLDDFVNAPDPYYEYIDTGVTASGVNTAGRWNAYLINMTSQMWLNSTYVNHPIWWHWLWIIIPDNVQYNDYATVVGTGGHTSSHWPSKNEEYFRSCQYMATHTKTMVAVLYDIPNEPLIFYNDPLQKSRSEDAIIAFGWNVYMSIYNQDPNDDFRYQWLTHFPMVKATVRAMDTVTDFVKTKNSNYKIERFGTAGASKRGWSTWLTAAYDSRVKIFIPMVMDMANLHPELHHMWRAYGGWTFAFDDYYEMNLTRELDTEAFQDLLSAADPYSYFDRYWGKWKMPIDAVNDEFFMPDDEAFWWDDFPEPKWFQINPDAEHSLTTAIEEVVPTLATFIKVYLDQYKMPIISWKIANGTGNITVTYSGNTSQIQSAKVWHGRSCWNDRRDFRLVNLDSPCRCGVGGNGGYCINLESVFLPYGISAVSMDSETAVYEAGPSKDPTLHWSGHMISIRVKFFDAEHPWFWPSSCDKNEKDNLDDDRLFLVSYGEMQFTTQVSIMPQTFPYADCQDAGCYGTLV